MRAVHERKGRTSCRRQLRIRREDRNIRSAVTPKNQQRTNNRHKVHRCYSSQRHRPDSATAKLRQAQTGLALAASQKENSRSEIRQLQCTVSLNFVRRAQVPNQGIVASLLRYPFHGRRGARIHHPSAQSEIPRQCFAAIRHQPRLHSHL